MKPLSALAGTAIFRRPLENDTGVLQEPPRKLRRPFGVYGVFLASAALTGGIIVYVSSPSSGMETSIRSSRALLTVMRWHWSPGQLFRARISVCARCTHSGHHQGGRGIDVDERIADDL